MIAITGATHDPAQVFSQVLDVSKSKQVDNWTEKTVSHFGTLDGAVNAAGVIGGKAF
ncbi:uncharacterized protein APUU_40830A [Aspergillus puulaauensis]|uniref:Uncharacterized protein n=1 Tax=Aspergillus puulaauensis TaxID=1220207 RepID=A0A7R8AMJ9_9EURO|nr:uncharacterized protein APUU_40830A [Aspergillus puulaauensis]BCS24386.1 hypothetical protein APUU_40830A [Aspergillus puulaauensis]